MATFPRVEKVNVTFVTDLAATRLPPGATRVLTRQKGRRTRHRPFCSWVGTWVFGYFTVPFTVSDVGLFEASLVIRMVTA